MIYYEVTPPSRKEKTGKLLEENVDLITTPKMFSDVPLSSLCDYNSEGDSMDYLLMYMSKQIIWRNKQD